MVKRPTKFRTPFFFVENKYIERVIREREREQRGGEGERGREGERERGREGKEGESTRVRGEGKRRCPTPRQLGAIGWCGRTADGEESPRLGWGGREAAVAAWCLLGAGKHLGCKRMRGEGVRILCGGGMHHFNMVRVCCRLRF